MTQDFLLSHKDLFSSYFNTIIKGSNPQGRLGAKSPIGMNLILKMTCFCVFDKKLTKIQIRKLQPRICEGIMKTAI